ncbi:MAG: Panacea domain-containing protein [Trebonia sp.]
MKLQKLCYYCYGYHLAWEARPLFPEHFEARASGPVCPALYEEYRERLTLDDGAVPGDADALDEGERESVDRVIQAYDDFTARQLCLMAHRESPWLNARRRAAVAALQRCTERLLDDEIYEYFDSLAPSSDDAPAAKD